MQISSLNANAQKKSNAKKYVLIGLIISVVLLLLLLVLLVLYSNMIPQKMILTIDGQSQNYTEDMFVFEDNNIYISLKDIANLIGYRYYDGGYKQFTQDKTSCYLESDDEVVVYQLDSDKINKTLNSTDVQYSEFTISKPVRQINNKLYVIAADLELGCNVSIAYNQSTNQMTINTLSSLYNFYNEKAMNNAYLNVDGLDDTFVNKKTIRYGMLVVKSTIREIEKYGVISLDGQKTYLDIKYDEISFIENLQCFLVKGDNKYGLMYKDGTQIIKLEYDQINLFDSMNNLFYVEKNDKKGILDENGEALGNMFVEYDEIGINKSLFSSNNIENPMLLYNKCIPVKKDDKWGIFNIEGELISNFTWDSLGYVDPKNSKNNILLAENVEGIIVCKDEKYGVINSEGKLLVPCIYDKVYAEIIEGKYRYYIQIGDESIEINDYINNEPTQQENNYNDDDVGAEETISQEQELQDSEDYNEEDINQNAEDYNAEDINQDTEEYTNQELYE